MKELDAAEAAQEAAGKAFAEALEASATHVVEVNRQEAEEFREQVLRLAGRVSQSGEQYENVRSRFRSELRDYSERARVQVTQLREELQAAGTAMQAFAQGVSASTGEHDSLLRREFRQLEEIAETQDIRGVRAAVHETVHAVTESYQGLKQAQAVVIAQLRDEIRVLQSELERGKRPAGLPAGVASRRELDREVDGLLLQGSAFAVVLAGIPEATDLYQRFPRNHVDDAIAGMVESFSRLADRGIPVTAYGPNLYGAVAAPGMVAEIWERQLAVSRVFQVDGIPRTLQVAPQLAVVERQRGESPAAFIERMAKAAEILTNPAT